MDEVIFEEFKGTGNSELRLSRQLADKRIFPPSTSTAPRPREEMLLNPDEVKITWKLRRALAGLDPQQALEVVLGKLKETSSNVEFLYQMQNVQMKVSTAGGAHRATAGTRTASAERALRVRVRPGADRRAPRGPGGTLRPRGARRCRARQARQPALRRAVQDRRGPRRMAGGGRRPRGGA
ncbi:hypothetical protein GCM10023065_31020 [Microbacterium laevaniformans]